ncbi:MAG: prohibitin family protein [Kiritimatiellae bacterium]|nr:prohibitin family protein [Kiritimatiellia bacterium]
MNKLKGIIPIAIILVVAFLIMGGCYKQIDPGEVGIRTFFGKITSQSLDEGLHFYWPIGGNIIVYDAKQQRMNCNTEVFTKDIQTAKIQFAINYSLDRTKIADLHQTVGISFEQKLIEPAVINAVKDVIGQWEADSLIAKRDEAAKLIFSTLNQVLDKYAIQVSAVNIMDISYSDAFEKAVEEKQVAMQNAIKAKNITDQKTEEGKQLVIMAEAEAKSMTTRAEALEKNKDLVLYEAVMKWDGKLPVYLMGDVVPLLNFSTPKQERTLSTRQRNESKEGAAK